MDGISRLLDMGAVCVGGTLLLGGVEVAVADPEGMSVTDAGYAVLQGGEPGDPGDPGEPGEPKRKKGRKPVAPEE